MSNSSYQRGRDAEYRAVNELLGAGWEATRNAGSHGHADVIAWNEHKVRFIQIKTWLNKKPAHTADIRALSEMRLPPYSSAEIWGRKVGQIGWHYQLVVKERT